MDFRFLESKKEILVHKILIRIFFDLIFVYSKVGSLLVGTNFDEWDFSTPVFFIFFYLHTYILWRIFGRVKVY